MKKILFFLIFSSIAFGLVSMCGAVKVISPTSSLPGVGESVHKEVIPGLIAWLIGATAVLAIIAITWAGIQMFLSVGNEEKFNQARSILIYALVGVGLAGGAYLIVQIISNLSFK